MTKACTKCGVVKPLDAFAKRARSPDGLRHDCRDCVRERHRAWSRENADRVRGYADARRQQDEASYLAKNREYAKAFRERNREQREQAKAEKAAARLAARDLRAALLAEQKARQKADRLVRQREKRKRLASVYGAVWYAKNKERLKPIRKVAQQRYAQKKPHVIAKYAADRRARLLRATPTWANPVAIEGFYAAAAWMSRASGKPHHVDHIEPLKGKHVCGLHCEFNLQVLPGTVNSAKGNRPSDVVGIR